MAVPSTILDLSTTVGSNSPAGTDAIGTLLDDYLRAGFKIQRDESENKSWERWGDTISGTPAAGTFAVVGNLTTRYTVGRRVKCTDATTLYGTIASSTFTSVTTVVLTMDSGALSGSLTEVALGPEVKAAYTAYTGDVTGTGSGSLALTIANDAVTYAKMQNVSATDKILGRSTSGAGDVEEIACTAAGRALIDDADAATQRTTLGAAPLASPTFTGVVTAPSVQFTAVTDNTTSGTTKTINFATQYHTISMTGNCTFTLTAPAAPCVVQLEMIQSSGGHTMTLPASVKWPAAYAAADKLLSTGASARDLLILRWNGTDYVAQLIKGIA